MTPPADRARPWRCPQDDTCPAKRAHDTYSAYRAGCRSDAARTDARRYYKQLRMGRNQPRIVDALGTRRRIQALAVLGWRHSDIAAHSGLPERTVNYLAQRATILERSARAIGRTYDQLSGTRGPSRVGATKAARRGWAPPLAWDDIDDPTERPKFGERRTGGERIDRSADIDRLTRAGKSAAEVAMELGTTARSVVRARARLGAKAEHDERSDQAGAA